MKKLVASAAVLLTAFLSQAQMSQTPWTPLYKGIDHSVGTNRTPTAYSVSVPGGPSATLINSTLQSVNCLRVDLSDPDVQLFPTPPVPASNYLAEVRETYSMTVSNFLKNNRLKVATDANFYSANPGGGDPQSEGVYCEVYGLQVCTGAVVSVADSGFEQRYASLLFKTNKQASFIFDNRPPGTNTTGIFTALTGYYPVLTNGINLWAVYSNGLAAAYPDPTVHQRQPRTVFGVSQDQRYLYLMIIDGRQSGYSDGAVDAEMGQWMLLFGAWNAINMDGGGSACMYKADCAGNPVALGRSSYVGGRGRERYIGSHFGVSTRALGEFISDVTAIPGSDTAVINWTTLSNASSQVEYGTTPAYGLSSPLNAALITNHSVTLSGLIPGTNYYFRVISVTETGQPFLLDNCVPFRTTNAHGGSGMVFGLTNVWRYTTTNLDSVPSWKTPGYNDAGWSNGPGLLWIDTVAASPYIEPKRTTLPVNPSTTYPYLSYYFRTHFTFTNSLDGVVLTFSNFLDDGAVFYLNGAELFRVRMPPSPSPIMNATLASSSPCLTYPSGDPNRANATTNCADLAYLSGSILNNLVQGDNVLAVEVHNALGNSKDITFGSALFYTLPAPPPPAPPFITNLTVLPGETNATITWTTRSNSTSQVQYGLTPALGLTTPLDSALVTSHSVTLTGLQRLTNYYFTVISSVGGTPYSATGSFATVAFYQNLLPLTNTWKYSSNNLDGVNWQAPAFNDAGWAGGSALLWIDRDPSPNPFVQPKFTELPWNPVTGLPRTTYYARTRFTLASLPAPGFTLVFSNFIDDGAVFYLNGTEIQRLRLPPAPQLITNATPATGEPASGDAVSADVFRLWGSSLNSLVVGTNLLAVEVHNLNAASPDITLGSSIGLVRSLASETRLSISRSAATVCIAWPGSYLTLQQSGDPANTNSWSDVPGPVIRSPFCVTNPVGARFFRVRN